MTRATTLLCLIVSVAVIASGCGHDSQATPKPEAETGVALNGDFSGSGPGTLLAAYTLPTIDRRLRAITSLAARVEYQSTSGITNSPTRVTGTVFIPKGKAPDGGWPVIALGHATSGLGHNCAPSLSPSLLDLAPGVTLLIHGGYAVTIADYQGLGSDQNYHPYLDPTTVGYNLIDLVRAAHRLDPDVSNTWLPLGLSQGAQAAWAANELSAKYGEGLNLVASVSLAPPLDLTVFADAAAAGNLTKEQQPPFIAILAALKNEYPSLNLDDYRRGIVQQQWDLLLRCDLVEANARDKVVDQITADDLRPANPAAVATLRGYLEKMSLPQQQAAAPMLVIYGDKDALIAASSTDGALAEACRMGDVIDIEKQTGKGHSDLDIAMAFPWMLARFKGEPVTDSCKPAPSPGASQGV